MKNGWRLFFSVLLWFMAMPAAFIIIGALEKNKNTSTSSYIFPIILVILVLWAGWIYWQNVPSASKLWLRLSYFFAYLGAMFFIGLLALWATFWAMVVIYGNGP